MIQEGIGPIEDVRSEFLHTTIEILLDPRLDGASIHRSNVLALKWHSVLAGVEHTVVVHGLLQTIILPAKEVISVSAVTFVIIV
jgi:hypothetical protein